jgi:hypothetical protein
MNHEWVDEKLKILSTKIGIFNSNPSEFYFEPTGKIYKKLQSGTEADIQSVAEAIAKHLGIGQSITVNYDWGIKMDPEVAGRINFSSPTQYIQIPFFYAGKKYALGSILAHEMSHTFLLFKGIWFEDQKENEMFTDLGAVFVGLGKLLLNGLVVPISEATGEGHVLGYLSPDLIAYSYKMVNRYRSIKEEVSMENLLPKAKRMLRNPQINEETDNGTC